MKALNPPPKPAWLVQQTMGDCSEKKQVANALSCSRTCCARFAFFWVCGGECAGQVLRMFWDVSRMPFTQCICSPKFYMLATTQALVLDFSHKLPGFLGGK